MLLNLLVTRGKLVKGYGIQQRKDTVVRRTVAQFDGLERKFSYDSDRVEG